MQVMDRVWEELGEAGLRRPDPSDAVSANLTGAEHAL